MSFDEAAPASSAAELTIFDDDLSCRYHRVDATLESAPGVGRPVHLHMELLWVDLPDCIRIEHEQVGITAGCDQPFFRVQASDLRERGTEGIDETGERNTIPDDTFGVKNRKAQFDTRQAVRDTDVGSASRSLLG